MRDVLQAFAVFFGTTLMLIGIVALGMIGIALWLFHTWDEADKRMRKP